VKNEKKTINENWTVQFLIATKNKPYMYCSACNVCYPQNKGEKKQHQNRKNKEEVELYTVSTSLSSESGTSTDAVYTA
jgi:hypothetical protein